jgi:hypothetical protein
MKVLIYMPFAYWTPHLATDLEIAKSHLDKGDDVHIIQCSGDFFYCEPNPNHFKLRCFLCKSKRNRGLDLINLRKDKRHGLSLEKFQYVPDLPEFTSMEQLKRFKFEGVDIGMSVASSLISMVREPNPDVSKYATFVNKNLLSSIAAYKSTKFHLEQINPDVFYLFNGRFASLRPALRAAQNLKIKTYVHERAGVLDKYSLTEGTYPHDLVYQKNQIENFWSDAVPLSKKEKIASNWYKERRGGSDQSWFSFTKSQLKDELPEGFDFSKRNIGIFISSQDEFEAITGWENSLYRNQTETINDIIHSDIDENIHYYLRVHPNLRGLKNTQTEELSHLVSSNLTVIEAEEKIDSYALIDACEKIITFGSTVGIESIFWGTPSILVGRSLYEDLIGCQIPTTKEELFSLINRKLDVPKNNEALKYAYWQAVRGYDYVYYKPESIRFGKFIGHDLENPILVKLKSKLLSIDLVSRLIYNCVYFVRKITWSLSLFKK